LRDAVKASNNQQGMDQIKRIEAQRGEMENSYDHYLATLHVYNPKMSEQDRLVLRVARIFGECELDMPPDFVTEVNKYIKLWQSSGRMEKAITKARENGYTTTISKQLLDEGLPPQFFYLALVESDFDPYISGPETRKGYAKGMWQFIPDTAVKYGLRLGPLVDLPRPDTLDDRHNYQRETVAASHYLKDLYGSDAQGSGLLVMACYNWGEDYVLPLVRSMPANPKDRNFWMLLQNHRDKIPKETYDYVFYIVSAAVIGENPRLFGFDFDNPLANLNARVSVNSAMRRVSGRRSHRLGQHNAGAKLDARPITAVADPKLVPSAYLTSKNRTMAIPKANVNPYPKLSIRTASFPFRRSTVPTSDMTQPVMSGLTTRLAPWILDGWTSG
jgi:hypothetical protein